MRPATLLLTLLGASTFCIGQEPSAPTHFEASDNAYPHKIVLTWVHVRGATSYRVLRGTTSDISQATALGLTPSIIYTDTTSPAGTFMNPKLTFFYWVQAIGTGVGGTAGPDQGSTSGNFSQGSLNRREVAVPDADPLTGSKIYLGKTLFWDEQLSSTKTTACGTCHRGRSGGGDPRSIHDPDGSTHPGNDGIFGNDDDARGSRGVPNSGSDGAYLWSQFGIKEQVTRRKALDVGDGAFGLSAVLWDGRANERFTDPVTGDLLIAKGAALESQALIPLLDTTEMANQGRTLDDVVARIVASKPLALSPSVPAPLARWIGDRSYPDLFDDAFGSPDITPAHIAMAIASYVRTLSPNRTLSDAILPPISLANGQLFMQGSGCANCHELPMPNDGVFRPTGVRPPDEDIGLAKFTGVAADTAAFRTPSLVNVGLRSTLFHNGRSSLKDVIDFYSRGGDFRPPGFDPTFIFVRNISEPDKQAIALFLRNALVDVRSANEAGPLFDQPTLYTESARMPVETGSAILDADGVSPKLIAVEPPLAGNPRFTVGLWDVPSGVPAVLVIDAKDPGAGPAIPASGSFARTAVVTSDNGMGGGFSSVTIAIPADAAAGTILFGRWYVTTSKGVAVSRAFRFTIFAPRSPDEDTLRNVSAATLFNGAVAPESIVTGFGENLAGTTEIAAAKTAPLSLAGINVSVVDSTGVEFAAPLFFASPAQINYLLPKGVAEGDATVRVISDGSEVAHGNLQVARVAPGLFAANADGHDAAAANLQQVHSNGAQVLTATAALVSDMQRQIASLIPLTPKADQYFLQLFGTGIRAGSNVSVTIGGVIAQVLGAAAQAEYPGLDQVTVRIPPEVAGSGEVDVLLKVDGKPANVVRVGFQ